MEVKKYSKEKREKSENWKGNIECNAWRCADGLRGFGLFYVRESRRRKGPIT